MSTHHFGVDDLSPIFKDFSSQSPHLLISLGGYFGGFGTTFEFSNVADAADVKKIFIRDIRRAVYHAGLPGLSSDVPSTAEVLRGLIAESGAKRVTMIGNSQGGFAAIMFGALLNIDYVHALSAQTLVGPLNRWKHRDYRWPHVAAQLYYKSLFKKKYWDLKKLLQSTTGKTKFNLHYGQKDPLDSVNAEYLRGCRGVTLHSYPLSKRQLLKHIMDSGQFDNILRGTAE